MRLTFTLILLFTIQNLYFCQTFWQNELKNKSLFVENVGQIKDNGLGKEILFSTEINGIEIFFTNKGYNAYH